jgi:hypothetical protein
MINCPPPDAPGPQALEKLKRQALRSKAFRRKLLDNPKAELKAAGLKVRPEVQVVVLQNTADTVYLVLPSAPEAEEKITSDLDVLKLSNCCPF